MSSIFILKLNYNYKSGKYKIRNYKYNRHVKANIVNKYMIVLSILIA